MKSTTREYPAYSSPHLRDHAAPTDHLTHCAPSPHPSPEMSRSRRAEGSQHGYIALGLLPARHLYLPSMYIHPYKPPSLILCIQVSTTPPPPSPPVPGATEPCLHVTLRTQETPISGSAPNGIGWFGDGEMVAQHVSIYHSSVGHISTATAGQSRSPGERWGHTKTRNRKDLHRSLPSWLLCNTSVGSAANGCVCVCVCACVCPSKFTPSPKSSSSNKQAADIQPPTSYLHPWTGMGWAEGRGVGCLWEVLQRLA